MNIIMIINHKWCSNTHLNKYALTGSHCFKVTQLLPKNIYIGPNRMRKKLLRNDNFYEHYPYVEPALIDKVGGVYVSHI